LEVALVLVQSPLPPFTVYAALGHTIHSLW
jgi:hypothetical protein